MTPRDNDTNLSLSNKYPTTVSEFSIEHFQSLLIRFCPLEN